MSRSHLWTVIAGLAVGVVWACDNEVTTVTPSSSAEHAGSLLRSNAAATGTATGSDGELGSTSPRRQTSSGAADPTTGNPLDATTGAPSLSPSDAFDSSDSSDSSDSTAGSTGSESPLHHRNTGSTGGGSNAFAPDAAVPA
jgi:hypothetical protein